MTSDEVKMLTCLSLLLFTASTSMGRPTVEDIFDFAVALSDVSNMDQPTIIATDVSDISLHDYDVNNVSIFTYSQSDPEELAANLIERSATVPLLYLFVGSDHESLFSLLSADGGNFFSSGSVTVTPRPAADRIRLSARLDSRVFYYTWEGDGFVVEEDYSISVKGGPVVTQHVGSWNATSGMVSMDEPNVWERRSDLGGITLNNTFLRFSPISMYVYDEEGKIVGRRGMYQDLLDALMARLNFSVETFPPEDGNWGRLKGDGSGRWNGMVGMLMENRTDLVTTSLAFTQERSAVIDYVPMGRFMTTLTMARPQAIAVNVWVYMDIFVIEAWFVGPVVGAALGLGFYLISRSGVESLHPPEDSERFGLLNCAGLMALMLIQQDYPVTRSMLPTRVLFLVSSMSAYLVFAYYTADLTTRMTTGSQMPTVASFEDVLLHGYRVLVHEQTSNHAALAAATPGTGMHKVYYETMEGSTEAFVNSAAEAKEVLLRDRTALFFGPAILFAGDERFVSLKIVDALYGIDGFGFAKGSELRKLL